MFGVKGLKRVGEGSFSSDTRPYSGLKPHVFHDLFLQALGLRV